MVLGVINQSGIKTPSTCSLNRSCVEVLLCDTVLGSLDVSGVPLSFLLGLEVLLSDVTSWTARSFGSSLGWSCVGFIVSLCN